MQRTDGAHEGIRFHSDDGPGERDQLCRHNAARVFGMSLRATCLYYTAHTSKGDKRMTSMGAVTPKTSCHREYQCELLAERAVVTYVDHCTAMSPRDWCSQAVEHTNRNKRDRFPLGRSTGTTAE